MPLSVVVLVMAASLRSQPVPPLATLPLTVNAHGLYLQVRLNQSEPMRFEFDSAAGWHVVNWKLAEALKLTLRENPSGAQGAGDGRARAAQILGATLQLAAIDLPFTPAAAINLDPVADRKGTDLNGLLGAPLLKRYIVETDPGTAMMRIYDPATWRYTGRGQQLPIRVDDMGVPHLRVTFQIAGAAPIEGEFKIDSAAGSTTLYFTSAFAEKHRLLQAVRAAGGKTLPDEVSGVGGSSKLWHARIAQIRVGATTFANPTIGITEAKGGTLGRADIAGIIGGGLLHRFSVIYDCPHNRLYLEPSNRLALPFEADMSGLRWLITGPRRNRFEVRAVLPGTPAASAGIQPGDRLLRVDGHAASTFRRDSLETRLKEAGRTVRLTLQRGTATIEAALGLVPLL